MDIGVLNVGTGSLSSFRTKIISIGHKFVEIQSPSDLSTVSRLILPGVGSFAYAADKLNKFFSNSLLTNYLNNPNNRVLGVCLGMQVLFKNSDEAASGVNGLTLFNCDIRKLTSDKPARIPHVGWSTIDIQKSGHFLSENIDGKDFYFVHSYALLDKNLDFDQFFDEYSVSMNGLCGFISSFRKNNIYACQFHPEKSSLAGSFLLKKFIES